MYEGINIFVMSVDVEWEKFLEAIAWLTLEDDSFVNNTLEEIMSHRTE